MPPARGCDRRCARRWREFWFRDEQTFVNSLARLIPFVWPSRRQLFLSMIFALFVAAMWGATLSVSYPVVKVLLQDETLAEHVQKEIDLCEKRIETSLEELKKYERDERTA